MYERRYAPPMMVRSSRDSRYPPMERPYPLPPMGPMRGEYGLSSRDMFSRRSPPPRGRSFGMYEDFSRDSFEDRRGGRDRYAPY